MPKRMKTPPQWLDHLVYSQPSLLLFIAQWVKRVRWPVPFHDYYGFFVSFSLSSLKSHRDRWLLWQSRLLKINHFDLRSRVRATWKLSLKKWKREQEVKSNRGDAVYIIFYGLGVLSLMTLENFCFIKIFFS